MATVAHVFLSYASIVYVKLLNGMYIGKELSKSIKQNQADRISIKLYDSFIFVQNKYEL
jgi:hypothetical protein